MGHVQFHLSVLSVSQQKIFKSTSSSLSCVFDPSPLLPVLYCLSCAKTLRRRLGLHEQRYVAVLLSAVNNDSRNAVQAATAVPHHRKTLQLTPLIMQASCVSDPTACLERKTVWIPKAATCRCVKSLHSAISFFGAEC